MRCIACNNILTTKEACTYLKSGTPAELCTACLGTTDLEVVIPKRFEAETFEDDDVFELNDDDPPPWEWDDNQGMKDET